MYETIEEVAVGDRVRFGEYEVTVDEIEAFADRYGPLGGHPAVAADADPAEPIANPWLATSMTERLLVDGFLSESGAQGSPGVEDLRWPTPAVPGDRLACELEVVATEDWDETRGLGTFELKTRNQDDGVVVAMTVHVLFPTAGDA